MDKEKVGVEEELYQDMLKKNNMQGSRSRPGCSYDNSCVESFFAFLKKEKIYRRKYDTIIEIKRDVFWYIELFYNRKRETLVVAIHDTGGVSS